MCRLFGLHAGPGPIAATLWLLDAPDSLAAQSHRNPDGTGIGGCAPGGRIVLDEQPLAAYENPEFATAARELHGTTFVAHVRYASTRARTVKNTHPFEQEGRLFAHNGVVGDLDRIDARLSELGGSHLVRGQTDSERVFALVTTETERSDGDLAAGLVAAATAGRHLDARTDRISARSHDLAERPAVVVASEPMDDDPGWRELGDGELVQVGPDLTCAPSTPFDPPAHVLALQDLEPAAAASQHPASASGRE